MIPDNINPNNIPQHVAIIMDGNGRWAQQRQERRLYGHEHALTAVRESITAARELGVKYLTLYAFSTENWNRHQEEVDGLMNLLATAISDEIGELLENGVRLYTIGDTDRLPANTRRSLNECIERTANGTKGNLILALSYSSRWELTRAAQQIASDAAAGRIKAEDIDENYISQHLNTAQFPDPDLLIRTGGELRLSNFLLWQMAYAEFYFTDLLWPDFRREHFFAAVADYQSRQRRFGKSGDQVENAAR